jgi:hypothetical protein
MIYEKYTDFLNESKRVIYSAVVLDDKSRSKLLAEFNDKIPEDWKIIAHHMTIAFAQGVDAVDRADDINKNVDIKVIKLGISDKAIAVQVKGFPSTNKIPHITLAVNDKEGGKPVMSNNIKKWINVKNVVLKGKVKEYIK